MRVGRLLGAIGLFVCIVWADGTGITDAVAALQRGDFVYAEATLKRELKTNPNNAEALGLLGIVLDNEKKFSEAEDVYRRAMQLDKNSSALLNNYGNHLLSEGDVNGARTVFLKIVAADPAHRNANLQLARIALGEKHASEALQYLDRIPESGRNAVDIALLRIEADYLADRRQKGQALVDAWTPAAQKDARVASSLGLALADAHEYGRAGMFFREAMEAGSARTEYLQVITDIAGRLRDAGEYKQAMDFLNPLAQVSPCCEVQMELAVATSHAVNPQAGLQVLDKIPESQRKAEYYVTRAEMLDAAGEIEEAGVALQSALNAEPNQPEVYRQTVVFLVKNSRVQQALAVVEEGARRLPDDREMLLLQATTLELAHKTEDAEKLLGEIERRWPKWPNAWLTHGIILETYKRYAEARQMVEKALALGARSAEAYYYLAESLLYTSPDQIDAAEKNITAADALAPDDPWILTLAGRIAFEKKHYAAAVEDLEKAIQLRPNLVQAHYVLAQTYKAMGKVQQSREELAQVSTIHQKSANDEADTSDVRRALFQVR